MKIGYAGPVSLQRLSKLVSNGDQLPAGYIFGPSADWIKELLRRGHDVTVYTTATEIQERQTFSGTNLRIRIAPSRIRGTGKDMYAKERMHLVQMMREDSCEFIHAHWTYEFALAALASKRPTLVTIHDLPWRVLRFLKDAHRVMRLLMAYRVAMGARHFTAVSTEAAIHFKKYFSPNTEVSVIPNGLPDAVLKAFELIPGERKYGHVFATILQGWTTRKNAHAAIMGFAIVKRRIPRARLMMFGTDFGNDGPAQQWAAAHNCLDGIQFVGPVPYERLLQVVGEEVDVIIHPSLDEAFSMTALESLAMKKPIIAGLKTPGMREILDDGNCGMLADVEDPQKIAEAMMRISEDQAYRERIVEMGYQRVLNRYRLEQVFNQYEALYNQILQYG